MIEEECQECGKIIGDDEWITNWGTCDTCFNTHYDNYMLGEAFVVSMGGWSSQYPGGVLMAQRYEFLDPAFLEVMNDIGRYGNDKYGKDSFHQRAKNGDRSRGVLDRAKSEVIIEHSFEHGKAYLAGELHDKFGTLKHQLAAAAFNALMEFYFAGLENESMQESSGS